MEVTATKANTTTTTTTASTEHQHWGMGFLLVLFPAEENNAKKKKNPSIFSLFSSSSSSSSSSPLIPIFKRSNSSHLLSKAQSTISICALLVFITLLLFTLSTFEPSSSSSSSSSHDLTRPSRRQLSQLKYCPPPPLSHALQGMGTLYRKGTKAMNDLVVAHVSESLNLYEFRMFLRVLYRSSLASRSDLLFIFAHKSAAFDSVILEEDDSFLKLVTRYREILRTRSSTGNSVNSTPNLSLTQFVKWSKKDEESGETIWGKRVKSNFSDGNETESTRLSYGSVVGFLVDELDPENSLAGFLDHVPMSLRRWACYPMLLGRVRRNFKHIMLVDAKEFLLTGDPMSRVRNSSPESIHLLTQSTPNRHGKKHSEKTHPKSVNPSIISGGARGIRRLSNAMLNEIVRAAMQRKKKNPVTESGLFNQLVGNEFLLKNVNLITSTESIPELSSLTESKSKPGSSPSSIANFTVVRRGNSNFDVNSTVLKHILCSSPLEISVYSNCL